MPMGKGAVIDAIDPRATNGPPRHTLKSLSPRPVSSDPPVNRDAIQRTGLGGALTLFRGLRLDKLLRPPIEQIRPLNKAR